MRLEYLPLPHEQWETIQFHCGLFYQARRDFLFLQMALYKSVSTLTITASRLVELEADASVEHYLRQSPCVGHLSLTLRPSPWTRSLCPLQSSLLGFRLRQKFITRGFN